MIPFCLWRTRTGALAYWKAKWWINARLIYDSPRLQGECRSRRFKVIFSYQVNNCIILENYYYRKSKPKPKIMFAYYQNHNGKIIKKDYTCLQKFK